MIISSAIAAHVLSPPTENAPYTLNPLNDTTHGAILSPGHMIVKLDCPGCPVYNPDWDTDATAIVGEIDPIIRCSC